MNVRGRLGALLSVGVACISLAACSGSVVVGGPPAAASSTTAPPSSATPPPPTPTVTVTKTATATATATKTRVAPSRTSSSKPDSWPSYDYYGPVDFDVCATASYPLDGMLSVGMAPIGASASGYTSQSVQAALASLNYHFTPLPSDSGYDSATAAAVKRFQENKGLVADGQVGPQTWKALHYWVNYYDGNCP